MLLTPQEAQLLAEELRDDEEVARAPSAEAVKRPPPEIGGYLIRRIIASGGMGTVYEAEQQHPQRIVALKVVRGGVASRSTLRRFDHETEILGKLQHSGIAQIYESGTYDDGSGAAPYFVMEYVPDAQAITEYVETHQLSLSQRLELFAQACDAVHHGHQRGIIHRDLKPDNILINTSGQPKIIDFGVARATNADVAVTTMQTDVGQLVGTLQYMSPEQCDGDPQDLDIRTDIYSLGAVLYELVCGQLPYYLGDTSIVKAARVIHEHEPCRPGTISKALRGNIEAIVLKALEKDRNGRYQSAADLARDIRCHLSREPIEARSPSRWSLAVHWLAHHPIVTTTAACLMIALLTLGTTWLAVGFLNRRPYEIEITPDRKEARLRSISGRILHTWRSEAEHGIGDAKLVDRPAELGGGTLAIIGFRQNDRSKLQSSLSAFHIQGDLDEPVWSRRVETEDILPELIARDFTGQQFGVQFSRTIDVFPEYPGQEIVVAFKHGPYSAGVIRIYDLEGELLFQLWQDGGVNSSYWMSDAEVLVFSGLDARAYWDERGFPEVQAAHPMVVFGVKPRAGHIAHEWIATTGQDDEIVPWYKCILPPDASDLFARRELPRPLASDEPGRHVRLDLPSREVYGALISWLIDEHGIVDPAARIVSDTYKRALDTLPPPDRFYLGELPPIKPSSGPTDEGPDAGN